MFGRPVITTRRPLEGGTLLSDYLGEGNLLWRTGALERGLEEARTSALSLTAAELVYVRRRGALLFSGWGQASVPASQSNATLSRFGVNWHAPLVLPFAGSVTAVLLAMSAQQTAGSLTVKVYVAGTASGLEAVIDSENRLFIEETAPAGQYTFAAGEPITLRVTTSGWAPTSADLFAMIEVAGA